MGEWATPKAGVSEREMDAERGGNEVDTPGDSLRHVLPVHSAAHPSEEEPGCRTLSHADVLFM